MGAASEHAAIGNLRKNPPVCVLGDDPNQVRLMTARLESAGFPVVAATKPEEALDKVRLGACRVVLADFKAPGTDSVSFIEKALRIDPGMYVIFVAGFHSVNSAIEAIERAAPRREEWRPLPLAEVRGIHIQRVLDMCNGNRVRAAHMLGIGRTSLYRFLKHTSKHAAAARSGA